MVPTGATTSERASLLGSQSRGFIVGLVFGLALAVCMVAVAARKDDGDAICLPGRLNPNTATVSSLARLPRVGLTRASAIVAYRTRVRHETGREAAFRCPDDLQQIKGIGPKTVADIAPWLDFGTSSDRTAEMSPPQAAIQPPEQ